MSYELVLSNPKKYYHELHRPSHLMKFADIEQEGMVYGEEKIRITDDQDLFK